MEDAQMTTVPIYLKVNPHMTLASLKDMVRACGLEPGALMAQRVGETAHRP